MAHVQESPRGGYIQDDWTIISHDFFFFFYTQSPLVRREFDFKRI